MFCFHFFNQGVKKSKQIVFDCKLLVLILYEIAAANTNTSLNTTICIVSSPCLR